MNRPGGTSLGEAGLVLLCAVSPLCAGVDPERLAVPSCGDRLSIDADHCPNLLPEASAIFGYNRSKDK
jgi:hypothetical protein